MLVYTGEGLLDEGMLPAEFIGIETMLILCGDSLELDGLAESLDGSLYVESAETYVTGCSGFLGKHDGACKHNESDPEECDQ